MKKPDKKTAIRIYSGNITAIGGSEGAGIGGGNEQPGARTYIYGGDITAESSLLGAGIGGGDEEGTMGIWIYDGSIYAAGGSHGAGIGAGEGGGNMRKAEDGGGVNILGGHVTAKGGFYGAGIGGGNDENVSGTITIKGDDTVVYASAGPEGAGIGSGSCGEWSDNGDMKAKITIDCGKNSSINAYGFDKEIIDEHPYDYFDYVYSQNINFTGAGIGAGDGGNMEGTVIIKGGNVNVWSGFGAAGIGGGMESGGFGGEGGDVYIGGGKIKILTHPNINYIRAPLKIPPKSSKDIINYCMCVPSSHRHVGYYRADKLKAWSLWTMYHSGYYCSTLFVVICTTRVRYLLIEYDLIKTEHRQDQPVLCF